jgi:OOP family OmpA-OmpF porin
MKNLLIIAALLAPAVNAQTINNWISNGNPVKNSTNLCWRNANWTPATAHPDCDGAIKAAPVVTPAPVSAPASIPAPAAPRVVATIEAPKPLVIKQSFSTDTLFDFDRAVIRPEGKTKLDELVAQISKITLEVVIAVGHTDSVGTDAYNNKLGERRAQAVKAYLISRGIERNRVYTESKGESRPVADNQTKEGRAKNRRVEIEVVGTSK